VSKLFLALATGCRAGGRELLVRGVCHSDPLAGSEQTKLARLLMHVVSIEVIKEYEAEHAGIVVAAAMNAQNNAQTAPHVRTCVCSRALACERTTSYL
jgi:hypothetical protein